MAGLSDLASFMMQFPEMWAAGMPGKPTGMGGSLYDLPGVNGQGGVSSAPVPDQATPTQPDAAAQAMADATVSQPAPSPAQTDTLGAILGSIQSSEPDKVPLPYTTTPRQSSQMSSQYLQLLLSQMMSGAPQQKTLGQLFAGR